MPRLIVFALLLAACATQPPTPSHAIADTEIALTAVIQTSDEMLKAACVKPGSDACGKALRWHERFLNSARVASASITGARKQSSADPASAASALQVANRVIQDLNAQIQAGVN